MQVLRSVSFPGMWLVKYGNYVIADNLDSPQTAVQVGIQWSSQS